MMRQERWTSRYLMSPRISRSGDAWLWDEDPWWTDSPIPPPPAVGIHSPFPPPAYSRQAKRKVAFMVALIPEPQKSFERSINKWISARGEKRHPRNQRDTGMTVGNGI